MNFIVFFLFALFSSAHICDTAPLEAPPVAPPLDEDVGTVAISTTTPPNPSSSPSPSAHPALPPPVKDTDEKRFSVMEEGRLRNGYLECPCSWSGRGFRFDQSTLNYSRAAILSPEWTVYKARAFYDNCTAKSGHEACVNWDSATIFTGVEGGLCKSDVETGRNVVRTGAHFRTVGSCQLRKDTASPVSSLRQNTTTTNNNAKIRVGNRAMARPEGGALKNKTTDTGGGFEGCVAVQHLVGIPRAQLQHVRHWWGEVLCSDSSGFCATPNHALIVGGEWTAMKKLCAARWNCTRTNAWVNNLSIIRGATRWRPVGLNTRENNNNNNSDIVVTPFDLRLSTLVTFILQVIEDAAVASIIAFSAFAIFTVGRSALVHFSAILSRKRCPN